MERKTAFSHFNLSSKFTQSNTKCLFCNKKLQASKLLGLVLSFDAVNVYMKSMHTIKFNGVFSLTFTTLCSHPLREVKK